MTRFLPQSNFDSSVTIQSFNKYINMHLSGRQLHVLTSSISVLTLETTQDLVSMNHQCVSSIPCLAPATVIMTSQKVSLSSATTCSRDHVND